MMKAEFYNWPHQSKERWMDQVIKDNPRSQASDFIFQSEKGITSDSFVFFEDLPANEVLNISSLIPSDWKIGTQIYLDDPQKTVSELGVAFENGIEYLTLNVIQNWNAEQLEHIFKNIQLDFIQTTWLFPDQFENFNDTLNYIRQQSSKQHRFICNTMNHFSKNNFDTAQFSVPQLSTSSLLEVIIDILNCISNNKSNVKHVLLKIYLGHDFLRNIYFLRALRIILQNIKELYSLSLEFKIEARLQPTCFGDSQHHNLIVASTISSSALLSGIDYLTTGLPVDSSLLKDLNWKKSSIHLQQILKQEAKLKDLKDPVSGSYYLDMLTLKYAKSVWKALQEKIKQ